MCKCLYLFFFLFSSKMLFCLLKMYVCTNFTLCEVNVAAKNKFKYKLSVIEDILLAFLQYVDLFLGCLRSFK